MAFFVAKTFAFEGTGARIALRCGRSLIPSPFQLRAGASPLPHAAGAPPPMPGPGRGRSASSRADDDDGDDARRWTLLYHRSPARSTSPRAMLGVSAFNFAYWTWYVADFAPSINASARAKAALGQLDPETLDLLLIDPTMGYVGLGIASAIFAGAYVYARQLVAAVWAPAGAAGERGRVAVATLRLPFLKAPAVLDRTVYDPEDNAFDNVEDLVFTEAELRAAPSVELFAPGKLALSEERRRHDALVKFDGRVSQLRGHISLREEDGNAEEGIVANLLQQRYLLDIDGEGEVMPNADPTLLHSLVLTEGQAAAAEMERRHSARKGDALRGKKNHRKRRY